MRVRPIAQVLLRSIDRLARRRDPVLESWTPPRVGIRCRNDGPSRSGRDALSRASRRRWSDNDIRCRASDRRWFPARPAQHVQRRRNNGKGRIQSAIASAHARDGKRRVGTCNMQRRTRRSASTLVGAAPDTIIGRAAAGRAGARPYQSERHRLIKCQIQGALRLIRIALAPACFPSSPPALR